MNKVYRVVFNNVTGNWVAVAETAKGRSKSSTKSIVSALMLAGLVSGVGFAGQAGAANVALNPTAQAFCGTPANGALLNSVWADGVALCGTAAGENAIANGGGSAFGDHAVTSGFYGTALGAYSVAATHATAVGTSALATGSDSFAGGVNAQAQGASSVALGNSSNAATTNSTAIGQRAKTANAAGSTAIGSNANADGGTTSGAWSATTVGTNASSVGDGTAAFGDSAKATADRALAVGRGAQATAANATAMGAGANASGQLSMALGNSANAAATGAVALGNVATVDATSGAGIAIGSGATVAANMGNAVALGNNSVADRSGAVSVGSSTQQRQIIQVAAGTALTDAVNVSQLTSLSTSTSTGLGSLSTGLSSTNSNVNSLSTSTSTGLGSLSTGLSSTNSSVNSLSTSTSTGLGSLSTGLSSTNSNVNSLSTSTSTGLGSLSTGLQNATRYFKADGNNNGSDDAIVDPGTNSVAIGANSHATRNNVVEIGDRQISGLAAGTEDTDAVNMSQLNTTNSNVTSLGNRVATNEGDITNLQSQMADAVKYDSPTHDSVTLGGASATAPVALKNVADGVVAAGSTDAVNGGQLKGVQDQIGTIGDVAALAVTYTDANKTDINLGNGTGGTTLIHNLGDGVTNNDAVNLGQLNTAKTALGDQISNVSTNLDNATRYFKASGKNDGSDDAVASGNNAVAVGANAQSKFDSGVAIGNGAAATWANAVAIGAGSAASQEAVALGHGAKAITTNAVAIGSGAIANAQSTVVGAGATSLPAGTALGQGAKVVAANGVALGSGATVMPMADNSVALGAGTVAMRSNSVDIGNRQVTSVAAGTEDSDAVNLSQLKAVSSQVGDIDALAVKYDDATKGAITLGGAAGTQIKNVADGVDSKDAVNVGQLNNVSSNLANATRYFKADGKNDGSDDAGVAAGSNSVAIGAGSTTTRSNVVEVGGRQISGLAAGTEDTDAVNVRQLKDAGLVDGSGNALDAVVYDAGSSKGSVTFAGVNGTVLNNVADGNIAAGSRQAVNGGQIAALRDSLQNQITNVDSRVTNLELTGGSNGAVAPDPHFVSAGDKDIAAVVTPGSASVGIGENAQATAHNAVAIGANSVADQANSVSVGSAGNERAIVNVADGVNLHDAANVGQMNNAINNSAAQTLQSANDYTDQRFGQISNAINDVDRHAQQGIAAAAALNNVTPYIPGKTSLNAGIAAYRGSTALGVTVSRWNQRGNMNLNAGVSSAGNGSTIVRAGVGIVFGN